MLDDYSNCVLLPLRNKQGEIIAFTLIDRKDLELVKEHTWRLLTQYPRYYAVRSIYNKGNFKTFRLHCVLMQTLDKPWLDVDHKNGFGLDNRRSNLSAMTHAQNMLNRTRKAAGTYSKHVGVSFDKSRNKWVAYVMVDYCMNHLGRFNTEQEALDATTKARKELNG